MLKTVRSFVWNTAEWIRFRLNGIVRFSLQSIEFGMCCTLKLEYRMWIAIKQKKNSPLSHIQRICENRRARTGLNRFDLATSTVCCLVFLLIVHLNLVEFVCMCLITIFSSKRLMSKFALYFYFVNGFGIGFSSLLLACCSHRLEKRLTLLYFIVRAENSFWLTHIPLPCIAISIDR